MTQDFLKRGDVIEIKAGTNVYTEIPSKFIFNNKRFSDELTEKLITIGQTLSNHIGIDWLMQPQRH